MLFLSNLKVHSQADFSVFPLSASISFHQIQQQSSTLQTSYQFGRADGGILHDSNSLSLLTEMSGVEAPVPLGPVPELQTLFSGLPGRCGDEPWRCVLCSEEEHSGELPEGRREESCCSLGEKFEIFNSMLEM